MLRNELLNNGYHFDLIEPKKRIINILWTFFIILFLVPVIWIYLLLIGGDIDNIIIPYVDFDISVINVMIIMIPVLYLISKEIITSIFRSGQSKNIENKLYSNSEMPMITYREAFKGWQIILIYLIPLIFMYPLLFIISIMSGGNVNLLILIFIMSFLMSFDLTLVIYVFFLNIRYKFDYIAVNNNIYSLTLYSTKHLERKQHVNPIKIIKKKTINIIDNLPEMRKILIPVICAGLLLVLGYNIFLNNKEMFIELNPNDFDTYLKYCDAMQPAVKDNNSFAEYTGCEILAGRNIIYCNDDGSVIYYDGKKDSVIRLDIYDNAQRLCIYEECRNNPEEYCGHMPNFVTNGCYADGVLYGFREYVSTNKKGLKIDKNYIIRYDIDTNIMDKFIELKTEEDGAYINKNFGLIYSEDALNKEYISKLQCFNNGYFYGSYPTETVFVLPTKPPVSGMIYRCNEDMRNFSVLMDLGYVTAIDIHTGHTIGYYSISARQVDVYGEYIYYVLDNASRLCRYNMKMKTTDEFISGIEEFYIDSDYLYYAVYDYVTYGGNLYHAKIIYRVKIDGNYTDYENKVTYVDFANPTLVYKPEHEYFLIDWNVKDNYVYTVLYVYSDDYDDFNALERTLTRTKINANSEPYVFW